MDVKVTTTRQFTVALPTAVPVSERLESPTRAESRRVDILRPHIRRALYDFLHGYRETPIGSPQLVKHRVRRRVMHVQRRGRCALDERTVRTFRILADGLR